MFVKVLPLSGIKILDCASVLPGGVSAQLFMELGADVTRITHPKVMQSRTHLTPYYDAIHRSKRKIELDLRAPGIQKTFHSLVKEHDAVIECFSEEKAHELGLSLDQLQKANPSICVLKIRGYPEDSPWADRPGHDINFMAKSGALSLFQGLPGLPLANLLGGYQAATHLLANIMATREDGIARGVSLNLYDILKESQAMIVEEYRKTGQSPSKGHSFVQGIYPCYRLYETSDKRWLAVGAVEPVFWKRFCLAIDHPELENSAFTQGEEATKVIQMIEETIRSRPLSEWTTVFENEECCVEPVLEYPEVFQ